MHSILLIFVLFSAALPSLARAEIATFGYETERLMKVKLRSGHQLAEVMIVYESNGQWYFPLGEFAEVLDFPINVSESLGLAEGTFLSREAEFRLDLSACIVRSDGYEANFAGASEGCPLATKFEGALYVSSKNLRLWFPLEFEVDSFAAEIVIAPLEPIPLTERLERKKRAEKVKASGGSSRSVNDDYVLLNDGDTFLTAPVFQQELGYQFNDNVDSSSQSFEASGSVAFEVAKFHSQTFYNYQNNKLGAFRSGLSRKDPGGTLLGPLGLKEISLLNTTKFQSPLVTRGGVVFGARVSSFSFHKSGSFSSHRIEGDLRPGWEVEIYQNGIFLNRSTGDEDSRYVFEDIPLLFGTNRLKLVFYGPQGQREEKTEVLVIQDNFLKPGEWDYRALLGIGEYGHSQFQLSVEKNVFHKFSARAGFDQIDLRQSEKNSRYASFGLIGLWSNLLVESNFAKDISSGHAVSLLARFPLFSSQSELSWTKLHDFSSDAYNPRPDDSLIRRYNFESQFLIPLNPSVSAQLQASVLEYESKSREIVLGNRLVTQVFGLYLRHRSDFTFRSTSKSFDAVFDVSYRIERDRIRVSTEYGNTGVSSIGVDYRLKMKDRYFLNPSLKYSVVSETLLSSLAMSKDFSVFSLSTQIFYQSDQSYGLGLNMATSFGTTDTGGASRFHHRDMTETAAAKIFVYIDKNRNGKRDEDEEVVPNMRVSVNGQEGGAVTRENGVAWVTHLNTYQRNELSISRRDILDPMLTLEDPGYAFIGRPAMVQYIEMPLVYIGEIDGIVEILSDGKVRPAVKALVELYRKGENQALQRVRTDREGLYLFTDIPPGMYTVKVGEWSQNFDEDLTPMSHDVEIVEGGAIEAGFNFLLPDD